MQHPTGKTPRSIAIVGAGPSMAEWPTLMAASTIEGDMVDEVWGINAVGRGVKVDVSFVMDDYNALRGHVPGMASYMETADHPVITSIARQACPTAVSFPLGDVLALPNARDFLNHSAAYAIAYAVALGVRQILVFGADYVSEQGSYNAGQKERPARYMACAAYWLGYAAARGVDIVVCPKSPLLDSDLHPNMRFYGYAFKPVIRRAEAPEQLAAAE